MPTRSRRPSSALALTPHRSFVASATRQESHVSRRCGHVSSSDEQPSELRSRSPTSTNIKPRSSPIVPNRYRCVIHASERVAHLASIAFIHPRIREIHPSILTVSTCFEDIRRVTRVTLAPSVIETTKSPLTHRL